MRQKVTKDNIPEIVRLYTEEYCTLQYLSQVYNKNRGQLKDILMKEGVEIRGRGLGRKPINVRYPIEKWCQLYKEGKTIQEIRAIFNNIYCEGTIRRYIKETIGLREYPIKGWIEKYEEGATLEELSKEYEVSLTTISDHLKKKGVAIRTMNDYKNPELIEDYFEVIDTEDKAYFLGLLLTDGNIIDPPDRQKITRLQLQKSDKYILEKFREQIKLSAQLSEDKRDGSWRIAIPSNKMAEDLAKYSCVPRKTTITELPLLEENLMPHLIRGLIDGNGTIYYNTRDKQQCYISLCGASPIVEQTRDYLAKELRLTKTKVITRLRRDNSIPLYVMQWGGRRNLLKIGEWLYKDATIYLERKYKKYLDMTIPC